MQLTPEISKTDISKYSAKKTHDVGMTLYRRTHVASTSIRCHVPAGYHIREYSVAHFILFFISNLVISNYRYVKVNFLRSENLL